MTIGRTCNLQFHVIDEFDFLSMCFFSPLRAIYVLLVETVMLFGQNLPHSHHKVKTFIYGIKIRVSTDLSILTKVKYSRKSGQILFYVVLLI